MSTTAAPSMNEANERDPFNNNSYGTLVDSGYKLVSLPILDVNDFNEHIDQHIVNDGNEHQFYQFNDIRGLYGVCSVDLADGFVSCPLGQRGRRYGLYRAMFCAVSII